MKRKKNISFEQIFSSAAVFSKMSKKLPLESFYRIIKNPEISIYASLETSKQFAQYMKKKKRKLFLKTCKMFITEKLDLQFETVYSKTLFVLSPDELDLISDERFIIIYFKNIKRLYNVFFSFNCYLVEQKDFSYSDEFLSYFSSQFKKIELSLNHCRKKTDF